MGHSALIFDRFQDVIRLHFRTMKRVLFFLGFAVISGCSDTSGPGAPLPELKHDPILFVHGYGGSASNWDVMKQNFLADGWQEVELYARNYSFISSNATTAADIRDEVDRIIRLTGASKVDIIAHSMGSISSRYYLKNLGGSAKVDAWVSLAGPNHGTDAVENQNCGFTPCREIVPGSAFLIALNGGDETPGLVRYGTWRSPCDTTINPDESVILSGATNTLTACIVHFNFLNDPTVYQQVRAFVD
jgi:triacylglycerol lipase